LRFLLFYNVFVFWASQVCDQVFPLLPILWQKLSPLVQVQLNLHPLLGADDVSGVAMVGGQYQSCCCQRSMNICLTFTIVQTAI
jgi:hypothetical protein